MQNLYNDLKELFSQHGQYIIDGKLNKPKIEDDGLNLDVGLIKLLLQNTKLKKHFFQDVDGVMVFDKVKFQRFINNKQFLPDCYTEFKNKIGLTVDGKFLTEAKEVVLDFPYKDCVLQGCQDQEDAKRDEVFFNETLAPDDIDMLLEPKVLTGFKKYDASGCHIVTDVTIQDNLIIKGNNLLALHSLKRVYRNKVKLIYIDPPYNTGNDGFKYNDKFNHSTWLTFMKNRLEIARELLRDDGAIFVQCDDNEQAYLKILMDEIFGRENFINQIIWRYRTYQGQVKDYFPRKHDNIFFYIKKDRPAFKLQYQDNFKDTVDFKRWCKHIINGNQIAFGNHPESDSRFTAYLNKYRKEFGEPKNGDIIYEVRGYVVDDVWDDIQALDPKNSTEKTNFRGGQKPESLIHRIISSMTSENDIILDYHLGSGTTAAVAHKMGRRYIGIEQMDYIDDLVITRLKNVIGINKNNQAQLIVDEGCQDYDISGISKAVNWCGGGSFIYCELMRNNQIWVDKINHTNSPKQLIQLWQLMQDKAQLSYKVDISQINANINKFEHLSLEEQKRFLIEVLDKNQLYVNYTEIDDVDYLVSDTDKQLNRKFYSMK